MGALPLLLLLHGRGGNELAMAGLADRFDRRFLVVSPRAPIETAPFAFQWFPEMFGARGPSVEAPDLAASTRVLAEFVDETVAALGPDPARVYLAGFSQGGTLAVAALLAVPERIAGVVAMSGWLPSAALEAAAPHPRVSTKPVLLIHGRHDETISPRLAREARAALGRIGLAVEHRELDMGHTTTPESIGAAARWLTSRLDEAPSAADAGERPN